MMNISRTSDTRVVGCMLHRTADIPGGVGVSCANLGGSILVEGTPIGKGENGLYKVCKTVRVTELASGSVKEYKVAKGHHFVPGEYFAVGTSAGKLITEVDKSDSEFDVIKTKTSLGVEVKAGASAFESSGDNATPKVLPVAVIGESYAITSGSNHTVNAWVIGVVNEASAPPVTDAMKQSLKAIVYL